MLPFQMVYSFYISNGIFFKNYKWSFVIIQSISNILGEINTGADVEGWGLCVLDSRNTNGEVFLAEKDNDTHKWKLGKLIA